MMQEGRCWWWSRLTRPIMKVLFYLWSHLAYPAFLMIASLYTCSQPLQYCRHLHENIEEICSYCFNCSFTEPTTTPHTVDKNHFFYTHMFIEVCMTLYPWNEPSVHILVVRETPTAQCALNTRSLCYISKEGPPTVKDDSLILPDHSKNAIWMLVFIEF